MKLSYDCLPCALQSYISNIDRSELPESEKQEYIRGFISSLKDIDFSISPPELGRILHNDIKEKTGNKDPYKKHKTFFNSILIDKYDELLKSLKQSDNPFESALRMTLAGNIIDMGVYRNIDLNEVFEKIDNSVLAIDDSRDLRKDIQKANTILYLGDNAGEIVFDKLFLQIINELYDAKRMYFAVRGDAIINDATRADAEFVGINEFAEVIDNGYDAPGTILEECSKDFRKIYNSADLIISKGQGNYESLDCEKKNIFFLLIAKCRVVAVRFGVVQGSLVVLKNKNRA
jgi:uncharacterized protein with ATP-grasp and redox domains